MGEHLLQWIRNRISKEEKRAFLVTFVFTLLVHMYKFTNTLPNHDGMYNVYTSQNMVGSGRWALRYACGISSYYDLPWVIGILCCLFIALTALVIVRLFRIRNPILGFLCGGILASSPATTETIFFLFTADGYFIAMFLAALGTYLSRVEEKRISRYILSTLCICVCCGIYQAYVSFALILAVCHFLYELLRNTEKPRDYFLWVLRQVLIFSLALALYYWLWQKIMSLTGVSANNYQGISEVGTITLDLLLYGWNNAWNSIGYYFFQLAAFGGEWALYGILNVLLLAALIIGLILAVVHTHTWKRPWALVLIGLCLLAVIPFAGMWCFTSYSVSYRPLMLQSLMVLLLFVGIVYEEWARPLLKNAAGLLLAVVVFHNALLANISYFYMNLCYERTYADAVEMAIEIHNVQDTDSFENIAVLGNRYSQVQWGFQNPDGSLSKEGQFYLLSSLLEENLLVDSDQIQGFLQWYLGIDTPFASGRTYSALSASEEVKQMPSWPADGSIKVIDGTLVLKLSEVE